VESTYSHSYEFALLTELPSRVSNHLFYPGATTLGGRDGVMVRVVPKRGEAWLGTFGFGPAENGVTGVFPTPDPDRLCVVAHGAGYLIDANQPTRWEKVLAIPIMDVRELPARDLLLFASLTELFAYNSDGLAWRTERLSWDSLTITEVSDRFIRGEFWDLQSEATATFTVDAATGRHFGGLREL
jgi:hypothetical protein